MPKHRLQRLAPTSEQEQGSVDRTREATDRREFLYGWIDGKAARLHLGLGSDSALYDLIRDHGLPFGRIGRHYRFRRCDLDQWAARRESASALRVVS